MEQHGDSPAGDRLVARTGQSFGDRCLRRRFRTGSLAWWCPLGCAEQGRPVVQGQGTDQGEQARAQSGGPKFL
jgi:hypothetical protein